MSRWIALFISLYVLASVGAHGQTSCLGEPSGEFTVAIDAEVSGEQFAQKLGNSKAQIAGSVVQFEGGSYLELTARFDPQFSGVSLPYNVFAVTAERAGDVVLSRDFTRGCKNAGRSFYPGTTVPIGKIPLDPTGLNPLRVFVWGRM